MKKTLLFILMLFAFQMMSAQNESGGCYRGFVDGGYTIGIGDYEFGRFEINTSHGYQINPYLFIGGGTGFHFMPKYETPNMNIAHDKRDSNVDIPVFANIRANFSKGKITPFVDGKAGTYVTNNGGLYINTSVGCRYALDKKQAVNVSVGYTIEKLEFQTFDRFINSYSMDYSRYANLLTAEGIAIKVGYEF